MSSKPYLPKVLLIKQGRKYRVEWDYQEYPESDVLFEGERYLTGYIEGFVAGLNISESDVLCLSSLTGTITNLSKESAEKIKLLLEQVLVSTVQRRHDSIEKIRTYRTISMVAVIYNKARHNRPQVGWTRCAERYM